VERRRGAARRRGTSGTRFFSFPHRPDGRIEKAIWLIRGHKVMLDRDLAALYEVPTKRLNEQVRRNLARFPEDFMFQLTKEEFGNWRSQIATSNPAAKMGVRRRPYAFTEQGVAIRQLMLPPPELDKKRKIGFARD
jgi:ORF6N domain